MIFSFHNKNKKNSNGSILLPIIKTKRQQSQIAALKKLIFIFNPQFLLYLARLR